ncbi:MAG: FHA domain-containing protein [Nannocystaceae bacterium]
MAVLERVRTGSQHVLAAHHVVGRAPACELRVSKPQVSSLHAELKWDGARWLVQDLGSRNGTFIDGARLSPGERTEVRRGCQLAFGDADDHYRMVEDEPPRLMAIATDGTCTVADSSLMSLPSSEEPELTIFEGTDGAWVLETAQGRRTAVDRETVTVDDRSWSIYLPTAADRTRDAESQPMTLRTIGLELLVSRDQEYVEVRITNERGSIGLEPRAHAQLLLALARARLEDRGDPQLGESEHGWVHREQLAKDLAVDLSLLNLWVHRARQQLVKAGVRDAGEVIERRPGTLQLRIGIPRLSVSPA